MIIETKNISMSALYRLYTSGKLIFGESDNSCMRGSYAEGPWHRKAIDAMLDRQFFRKIFFYKDACGHLVCLGCNTHNQDVITAIIMFIGDGMKSTSGRAYRTLNANEMSMTKCPMLEYVYAADCGQDELGDFMEYASL